MGVRVRRTGPAGILVSLVITCAVGLLVGGCHTSPPVSGEIVPGARATGAIEERQMPRIAIATAYAPEFAALIPKLEAAKEHPIHGVSYWTGTMQDQNVVLFETGVSLVNAAMNTERLLSNFNVSSLVVSGVAGGLDPSLTIGDVTVPARWAQYNESVYMRETADGGFKPHPGVEPDMPAFGFIGTRGVRIASADEPAPQAEIWFEASPDLLSLAKKAAARTNLERCDSAGLCLPEPPEIIVGGNGVTGSIFMDNARFRDYLHEVFEAQVVEMETAAIAMVAHAHDIPFIAFRSLSDLAGGGKAESNEITAFQHLAAVNSAAVVLAFLDAYGDEFSTSAEGPVEQAYCEINFSAASIYAGGALGAEFVEQLRARLADDEVQYEFLGTQTQRALQVAQLVASEQDTDVGAEVLQVWGGYKGRTNPSLAMRFDAGGPDARRMAETVAAALGYVFMQESVIAQCPDSGSEPDAVASINLVEEGPRDILSVDTLEPVFGMMLGQADGNFDLGFTYYPQEDRFSTLGFTDGGTFERKAMSKAVGTLQVLTGSTGQLTLSETSKWVRFPHNDWDEQSDGAGYLETHGILEIKSALDSIRHGFLIDLETFANGQQG